MCGYACKDSEPTGATADLFKDMVNNVDTTNADQISGKSMCAKMLIKTVGRRGISGPEASFELSELAPSTTTRLHTCQCQGQGDLSGMATLQLAALLWINA